MVISYCIFQGIVLKSRGGSCYVCMGIAQYNSAQLAHKATPCHRLQGGEELSVVAGAGEEGDHPGAGCADSIRPIKHYGAALLRIEIKIVHNNITKG